MGLVSSKILNEICDTLTYNILRALIKIRVTKF